MKIKKLLAAVLSAGLVVGCAASASAAPSMMNALDTNQVSASEGTISIAEKSVEDLANEHGEEVGKLAEAIESATVDNTLYELFEQAMAPEDFEKLEIKLFEGVEEIENVDLEKFKILSRLVELEIEGAEPTEENPVDVTFTVNNATDDIDVYVLHLCEEHGWELIATKKTADNQIVAPFHSSASLVALAYMEKEDVTTDVEAPATK